VTCIVYQQLFKCFGIEDRILKLKQILTVIKSEEWAESQVTNLVAKFPFFLFLS